MLCCCCIYNYYRLIIIIRCWHRALTHENFTIVQARPSSSAVLLTFTYDMNEDDFNDSDTLQWFVNTLLNQCMGREVS